MKRRRCELQAPRGVKTQFNPRGLQCGDVVYVIGKKENCTGNERWPNRPAIIISRNVVNQSTVQVVYLSHHLKAGRYNINVTDANGRMYRACCDQVHCVDYSRIGNFLYSVSEAEMYGVKKAIVDNMSLYVDNHEFDKREFNMKKNRKRIEKDVIKSNIIDKKFSMQVKCS